ncbi:MAG: AraC family transcriptional regulator [Pseudomonadota bacterium]
MKPLRRFQNAINFIEENLDEPLTVDQIAATANFSTYHFARVFRALTGRSVMEYTRRRRIARAILQLRSDKHAALIDIAIAAGFDSQQGFTNAFKRMYGITPGSYREHRFALPIQEKIDMTTNTPYRPHGPEYRVRDAFQIAGIAHQYTIERRVEIPQLWMQFVPMIGSIPNQVGYNTYGTCLSEPDAHGEFTYVAAVEISSPDGIDGLSCHTIPAANYAVFTHAESLDRIGNTMNYIFGEWLANSGHELNGTPDFESYDERFNPATGSGEMEIWVPVKPT